MKQILNKKILIYTLGTVAGAISGYLYWKFIGCESGTCAITSKPLNITLYFGLVGFIGAGLLIPSKAKE